MKHEITTYARTEVRYNMSLASDTYVKVACRNLKEALAVAREAIAAGAWHATVSTETQVYCNGYFDRMSTVDFCLYPDEPMDFTYKYTYYGVKSRTESATWLKKWGSRLRGYVLR